MISGTNPNNNEQKRNYIMELWYQATGIKTETVNLARNKKVEKATLADEEAYFSSVENKEIPLVANEPIKVGRDQNLHIINISDTHYFDTKNHAKGIEDGTYYEAIKDALSNKDAKDKTVAFLSGNLIGSEWLISNLGNAKLTKKNEILFWGLQKRIDKLIEDINFIATEGADEIILMNGREEHAANKKVNTQVLEEEFLKRFNRFNKLLINYLVERVNEKAEDGSVNKRVKIRYVEGVKKVFNVVKKGKEDKNYTISMHTNLKTTSNLLGGNYMAAVRQHAGLASADVILVKSENAAGVPDEDKRVIFLSGLSKYANNTIGNVPAYAPKDYNSFTILLGDKSHDVEVVRSPNFINENTYALEKLNAIELEKNKLLAKLIKEKIDEKLKGFANKKVNYKADAEKLNKAKNDREM